MSAMNEEAPKSHTDCVYFLASPLTCKKGNDCDYRHSESARINPRDCRFWLSGTCGVVDCPFRHPPLEGLPATAVAPCKSRVPCFFYTQGYCFKGENCAFVHKLPLLSTPKVAVPQKLSAPLSVQRRGPNHNEVAANQGNGATSKASLQSIQSVQTSVDMEVEAQVPNAEAHPATEEEVHDVVANRMPKKSASPATASPQIHPAISREVNMLHQLQPADDGRFLHKLREKRMHDDQPENPRSHHGDEWFCQTIQNGRESEKWRESDVLVDGAPDHLISAEEGEYLPHHEVAMGSGCHHLVGRMMKSDELADFQYDHSGADDDSAGYYNASVPYACGSSERRLFHDCLDAYDHSGGRRPAVALKQWRDGHSEERDIRIVRQDAGVFKHRRVDGMVVRSGHREVYDGQIRGGGDDLRDYIVERRRAVRARQERDHHRRRHREVVLSNDFRRYHDVDDPQQQDRFVRRSILAQQETRSEGRWLGFPSSNDDIDDSGIGSVRSAVSWGGGDQNAKARHLAMQAAKLPKIRSPSICKFQNDDDDSHLFAGPKTLAQIKAEKMKLGRREVRSRPCLSHVPDKHQALPMKRPICCLSPNFESGGEAGKDEKPNVGKAVMMNDDVVQACDFEGPRPLGEILKAKNKGKILSGEVGLEEEGSGGKEHLQKGLSFRTEMSSMANSKPQDPCPHAMESVELVHTAGLGADDVHMRERKQHISISDHRNDEILQADAHVDLSLSISREIGQVGESTVEDRASIEIKDCDGGSMEQDVQFYGHSHHEFDGNLRNFFF